MSLKMQAANSVKLTSLSTIITGVLQLIQLIVLGRVLGPEVFGIIALIQIVIQFAHMYMDMGITDAIIQKKKISQVELSSLYWFSIVVGFIMFGLLFLISPLIAGAFQQPQLKELVQVIGISFVIIPFGLQFQTLATKNLEFANISKHEIISTFIGVTVTIILASYFNFGAWSLVVGHIVMTVFRTAPWVVIGFVNPATRPTLQFSWSAVKGSVSFGMYRLGTNTANYFNTKIDQIIIGMMMGPQILGFYSMAMNLIMQPIQKLNPMITKVSFPVFSKIQHEKARLQKGYLFIIKVIMTLNAPMFGGLIVLAPFLIPVLLGGEWSNIVPIVQILCFYALFRALGNPSGSLFIAVGKVRWSFYWQIALLFVIPIVVYFASLTGEIAIVAIAMGALRFALFFINYFARIRLIIGACLPELLKAIFVPIFHSAIMMLLLAVLLSQLSVTEETILIIVTVLMGGAIYSSLLLIFQRNLVKEVKGFFVKKALV
ncbi:MOP flippase family protein [Planococcus salinus]|uniref:Colanic acid exporter n=1 Tax=Planococcus salinus TaxID=1848460 RepID=A0A3M8P8D3_9BACL|nr:MOP flippase family protein [Planococcus salinus]RNF39520.1 colanic acid exporter [Planococcus salinus]